MRVYGFHSEEYVPQGVKSTATYTRLPARTSTSYQSVAQDTIRPTPMAAAQNPSHRVQAGENLTRIVRDLLQEQGQTPTNTTIFNGVRNVAKHNKLPNANLIHPGQDIDLSVLLERTASVVASPKALPTSVEPLVASSPLPALAAKVAPVDPLRETALTRSPAPLKINVAALPSPAASLVAPSHRETADTDVPKTVDTSVGAAIALQKILNGTADSLALIQGLLEEPESAVPSAPANPWGSVLKGSARLSSDYGIRKDPFTGRLAFHDGIDIAVKRGTEITALRDGEVVYSGWKGGYGNTVIVRHEDGLESVYGHTAKNLVSLGERVRAGSVLAEVGSTGRSTGPHLHLEMRRHGKSINPLPHLEERPLQFARNGLGS